MKVELNLEKFTPWLDKRKLRIFCICFATIPSKSKKKIMVRLDRWQFFTLQEIEKEIGEPVFTIHD